MNKRVWLQIILALGIVVIFHFFIDVQLYRPFVGKCQPFFRSKDSLGITSISLWALVFSLVFFIQPNKLIANFIVVSGVPITVVFFISSFKGCFYDFMHMPTSLMWFVIFVKYFKMVDKILLLKLYCFLIIWVSIVRLLEFNYLYVDFFPNGVFYASLWIILLIGYYKLVRLRLRAKIFCVDV